MELHEALDKYIRRYYSDWLGCSRRWCSMWGIPQEAYDLLGDVLESICRQPASKLQDMIEHEEADDRKLFFYVRKAIRLQILEYRARKYQQVCSVDLLPHLRYADDEQEAADEMFSEFRQVASTIRADDFVDPHHMYNGCGRICRYVTTEKAKTGNKRPRVRYEAITTTGIQRQFSRFSSAVAFLAGQNPPPEKVARDRPKTVIYALGRITTFTKTTSHYEFKQQLFRRHQLLWPADHRIHRAEADQRYYMVVVVGSRAYVDALCSYRAILPRSFSWLDYQRE